MCMTYQSNKDSSKWFLKALRRTQQLQVTEKEKKLQLQVKSKKEVYTVSQSQSSEVEQDNEYIIMKLLNNNKEYEIILFNSDDELFKNQKISSLVTVNKFYSEIQSIKKEYSSELWNAAYKNILETL